MTQQLPRVTVPALVAPAVGEAADGPEGPDGSGDTDPRRRGPERAMSLLPDAVVSWYVGADHDLHAQHPGRLADDLVALAARVEAGRR